MSAMPGMPRVLLVVATVIAAVGSGVVLGPTVGPVELGAAQTTRPNPNQPAYRFEELAEGVHFAIGTGAMTVMSNSLVIINDDHVMLVDTSVTPAAARALVGQIKADLTAKPIRYVFNSHYHFDHAHGNQIFGDGVEIIGHEYVRMMHLSNALEQRTNRSFNSVIPDQITELKGEIAQTTDPAAREPLEMDLRVREAHWNALKETVLTPPNVTYRDALTLHKGGREVQLRFVGRGHTGGDTMVFLPAERIVFTGDFFLGAPGGPRLPFMGDAYADEWPQSIERLKGLDFDVIVPGHGTPFREREQLTYLQHYLRDLWSQVASFRNQGLSVEQATERVDMSRHAVHYGDRVSSVDPRAITRIYELLQVRGAI